MRTAEQKKRHADYMREYLRANPEQREAARQRSLESLKDPAKLEANRARARAWALANRDRAREKARAHYENADKETRRNQERAWVERNREKFRVYQRGYQNMRRAKLRASSVGPINYEALIVAANGQCALCHLSLGENFHYDHIIAIAHGGSHTQDNLQVTHPRCNQRKSARSEWAHLFQRNEC